VISVREARFPDDLEAVRGLLRAFAAADPDVVRSCEDLRAELGGLPGEYRPPNGGMFVATRNDGVPFGCVAVRAFDTTTAEMKRLYVGPEARNLVAGTRFLELRLRS